jgi:hypothetical protein
MRKASYGERAEALEALGREISQLKFEAKDWKTLIPAAVSDPKGTASNWVSDILVCLFLPPTTAIENPQARGRTQLELIRVGLALAVYRAEHGAYPAKLADLAPKYIATIPKDEFSDEDLHYKLDGDGFLLYSVGINGRDDGGKGLDDATNGEDWDDLSIRIKDGRNERRQSG